MIQVIHVGKYRLIETKQDTKILILDKRNRFAWITVKGIGEILVGTHRPHITDAILAVGNYRLYDVDGEKDLSDQLHLELSVGEGEWQGYLLPTGLPTDRKTKSRIIPTDEVITMNHLASSSSRA